MRITLLSVILICLFYCLLFAQDKVADYEKNWPHWRGPYANGVASDGNAPLKWSETQNVKWKIEVPGYGHSTPIIWGDQLFVTTAISQNEQTNKSEQPEQSQGMTISTPLAL